MLHPPKQHVFFEFLVKYKAFYFSKKAGGYNTPCLDISRAITAERSLLHIASDRTRTRNPCFPSAVANC